MGMELAGKRRVDVVSRVAVRVCAHYAMASGSRAADLELTEPTAPVGLFLQILGAVKSRITRSCSPVMDTGQTSLCSVVS